MPAPDKPRFSYQYGDVSKVVTGDASMLSSLVSSNVLRSVLSSKKSHAPQVVGVFQLIPHNPELGNFLEEVKKASQSLFGLTYEGVVDQFHPGLIALVYNATEYPMAKEFTQEAGINLIPRIRVFGHNARMCFEDKPVMDLRNADLKMILHDNLQECDGARLSKYAKDFRKANEEYGLTRLEDIALAAFEKGMNNLSNWSNDSARYRTQFAYLYGLVTDGNLQAKV